MIIWLNGSFGVGKHQVAYELQRRLAKGFVYHPERVGRFINQQLPTDLQKTSYRDYPEWRQWNIELLQKISQKSNQVILLPLALAQPEYIAEITEALREDNIEIHHYLLTAEPQTIKQRLQLRGSLTNLSTLARLEQRTLTFDREFFSNVLTTDQQSIAEIADVIAKDCHLRIHPAPAHKSVQALLQIGDHLKSWRL